MGNLSQFLKEEGISFSKNFLQEKFRRSKIFLNLLAVLTFNSADAQIIKWDFDEGSGSDLPFQNVNYVSASKLVQGNNYGATTVLITNASPSSGYSGSSGNYNAGAATVSAGFNLSTSTYFEFALTPDQGYSLTVNAINFGSRSTSTGPKAYSILSSVDSYSAEIVTDTVPVDGKWYFYENKGFAVSNNSSVTFRIYGFNGAGAKQNTTVWRIDDLSIDVSITPIQTYYRSRQSGNWASSSTWEYSTDNVNWNISSLCPSMNVENILIQASHTVTVNSPASLDQAVIEGTLELQTGGVLNINDGNGDDLLIKENGVLKIVSSDNYTSSILQSTDANINISTNGKIEIGDGSLFTGDGYEGFATSAKNVWNDGAVFEYNNNKPFQAPGLIYFPTVASSIIPVFRIVTVNGTPGVGSSSDFRVNGILEVNTNLTFSGTGDKYFRNGIKGIATLTATGSGQIFIDGTNAILDGSSLNFVLKNNLKLLANCIIPENAVVTISGANLDNNLAGNILTINGTLNVTSFGVKNTNGKIILNGFYRTTNPGGFSGTGSSIPSGSIIVNLGSTIELYANGNQSINARTDFSNLIFSGSGIKAPNGPFSPHGTLTIKDDAVLDCTGNINGINIGDENTNLAMSGNSRLIVSTFGPNPKMDGVYTLSGGVIEFRGTGATPQTIRNKNYQNIEVTGTNVGMSEGNIKLNTNGTFTVKTGGIFWINDNTITGNGDHTQTVKVESGAIFKCGTNLGFNGAIITSAPIQSSAINEDITNIILQPGSTIDYSRNIDQPITNANGLVYQNLVISGTGNKTAPSDNLIIQGDFIKSSNAVFLHNNGTAIFNGNNSQTYACQFPKIIFNNLRIENNVNFTINDSLAIYNEFLLKDNVVLNLNGKVIFLSSKENTASLGPVEKNVNINYAAGDCIVERFINTDYGNGGHKKSWQFLSTPAFGKTIFETWQEKGSKNILGYGTWITDKSGTANGFDAISAAPSMKYYEVNSNSWVGISATNIKLENEKGYMLFVRGDRLSTSVNSPVTPTILRTEGKLYTPQFPPPISIIPAAKFQSVGNPYASAIDFSKIISSNIQSSYAAWDPTLGGDYGFGGYQTISPILGYRAVPGNTANYNATSDYRYIQSGQSFFVFNYTPSDGAVEFSEDCKVSGNHHLVTREAGQTNRTLFANLFLSNDKLIDGNAVSFSTQFSNEVDGDDALKISGDGITFSLKRSGKFLSVEARNKILISDTIFYSLQNLPRQSYKLGFIPERMEPGFEAFLKDEFLKTETPVKLTDTSVVNFSVTEDKASAMPGRFFIIFRESSTLPMSLLSMNAYLKNGNIWIVWKAGNENDIKNYQVEYSQDGIHFLNLGIVEPKNESINNYEFIHQRPGAGNNFYRIRINKIDGGVQFSKVAKVAIPRSGSSMMIYPNPVQDGVIGLQFTNQPLGKYRFNLYNFSGQKVFSEESNYKGEGALSLNPRKKLTAGIYQLEIIKPNEERTSLKINIE